MKTGWQRCDAIVTGPSGFVICEDRGYPAWPAAVSLQSVGLSRLGCRLARRLALLHLLLLSGMLLFDLLRLLSVALLHLLILRGAVVFRGGLLMFLFLLLLEALVVRVLPGS